MLFVGNHTRENDNGVLDIDGAFRSSSWQLAYQLARSFENGTGGFAGSAGFTQFAETWLTLIRGRAVQESFDISQVGFVPWRGTAQFVGITGPRWYYQEGYVKQILMYFGPVLNYEKVDQFTDYGFAAGYNMQFRTNWGFEINASYLKSKDLAKTFNSTELTFSSWFNTSPKWHANAWGGYTRTYNFSRDFLAFYSWMGSYFRWQAADFLDLGTNMSIFIEGNPEGSVEDITYNARPYCSVTPVNDLNIRVYVDNVYVRSTKQLQQMIVGFLFSYNFSPKSWIYLAINEIQDRSARFTDSGIPLPNTLHTTSRAGVLKIKYLYYF